MPIQGLNFLSLNEKLDAFHRGDIDGNGVHNGIDGQRFGLNSGLEIGEEVVLKVNVGGPIGCQKDGAHGGGRRKDAAVTLV